MGRETNHGTESAQSFGISGVPDVANFPPPMAKKRDSAIATVDAQQV